MENFENLKFRFFRGLATMSDKEWKKAFECSKLDRLADIEKYSALKDDLTIDELNLIFLVRCCDDYTIGTLSLLVGLVEKKLMFLKDEALFSIAIDNAKQ